MRGSCGSISQSEIVSASRTTSKKVWTPQQARVEGGPFFFFSRKLPTPNRRTLRNLDYAVEAGNCSAIVTGSTPSESAGGRDMYCTQYVRTVLTPDSPVCHSLTLFRSTLLTLNQEGREQSTQGWTITRKWKIVPTHLSSRRQSDLERARARDALRIANCRRISTRSSIPWYADPSPSSRSCSRLVQPGWVC